MTPNEQIELRALLLSIINEIGKGNPENMMNCVETLERHVQSLIDHNVNIALLKNAEIKLTKKYGRKS